MAVTGGAIGTTVGATAVVANGAVGMTAVGTVVAGTATGAGVGALTTIGVLGGLAAIGAVGAVIATGGLAAIPMIVTGYSAATVGTVTAGGVMGAELEDYSDSFDGSNFISYNPELSPMIDISAYEFI